MKNMQKSKPMNILLWVLQILIALYTILGAVYMVGHYEDLATEWALGLLPQPFWMSIGILQIVLAIGLVLPAVLKKSPKIISISAAFLALLSLLGSVLFVAYAGFPGILWAMIPSVLLAFIAYGRLPTKN